MTSRPDSQVTADADALAPIATGRVLQVNVSQGGVPKTPVEGAWVGRLGLEGDAHRDATEHGGPHRAVCLFGMEVIERLQSEGHPIEPGGAGENLTTWGIEWSLLPVGSRVRVGDELELELSSSTTPCKTQTGNFSDGNFNRIRIDFHPSDSRMYARVLREGEVRPGDAIVVLPAAPDSRAADEVLLKRLHRAEGKSTAAAWRAAHEAGFQIETVEDGEVGMASSRDIPGPAFNQAFGFIGLPNLLEMATAFYDRQGTPGWIWTLDQPTPEAAPDLTLDFFGAMPDAVAEASTPEGVVIRRMPPAEASRFGGISTGSATVGGVTPGATDPWPRVNSQLARASGRHIFIAEIDDEPVGSAALHVSARVGWMRAAVVAPRARGRGIQRALIAARARHAAELGCDLVGASAEPGSVSALNLAKTGLRALERASNYVYENGEWRR